MRKFTFFIKTVLPAIMAVHSTDDGSLHIQYRNNGENKSTIMTLSDYEIATAESKKIDGFMDHIHGLS